MSVRGFIFILLSVGALAEWLVLLALLAYWLSF